MTQTFRLSLFKHKRDTTPQTVERNWQQLCANFQKPQIRFEKDGLLFSPALFEPSYRKKENVREVSMLVLDIDHNAELEMLKTKLAALDSAFAIYSTHSHLRRTETNPNAEPRFRVCLPLVSAIPAKDFPALWQFVKQKTGLPLDESAKDESRMFYAPAIAEPDAPYVFEFKDNAFLNWRELPLDLVTANGNTNGNNCKTGSKFIFEFHEERHAELCRLIEAQARNTGRGTFEMKCPAHNGKGDSSLFYEPEAKRIACLKKPNSCSYFEILAAFQLPNEHLPSRDYSEKQKAEFEETETTIKPFPVPAEKCFYGLAGDFVCLIEPHTEASSAALLIQFLTYFGNIIGRSAYYQVEADKHFTNLFCVLVGDTASGRKGTSFGRVKEIFKGEDEAHEKECIVSGLASGEGLLYQIRDAVWEDKTDKKTKQVETVCTDNGVSDKRLLIVEGEFSQVLRVQGREGNTLSAFLRNLWDNGTARNLTKNSPLRTTDALVSVIGHITKTELLNCLDEVESANGYANRFLWFAVRRSKFLPFGAGEIDSYELMNFQRELSQRIRFAQNVNRMIFTTEARNLFAAEYCRLETSRYGFLAKITQRATAYVCRLSCIFALLDGKDEIGRKHLEAALAVWQYAEDSARYIFGTRSGDKNADLILNALCESETGLSRTEIRDLFDRHISNEKLNSALSLLLENGLAEPKKEETKGRAKEIWFACVISVESVQSVENENTEQSLNAYNAKNAEERNDSPNCQNCGLLLELTEDKTILFCPFGCKSRKVKS